MEGNVAERSKGPGNRKGYIRFIILIMLAAMLIRIVIGVGNKAPDTALVGYGDIMIAEKALGVIVRDEKVINAPISGDVTYIVNENVRIPVNTKLFEIKDCKITSGLTEQYNKINERLEALQSLEDNRTFPVEINETVNDILSNIVFLLDSGNLSTVYYEKERLTRQINYSLAATITQPEKGELIRKKDELDMIIEDGVKNEKAPFSGVPVYSLDGYEEILSPGNINEIIQLKDIRGKAKAIDLAKGVKAGEPVMKVVNNHLWYLICNLSEDFVTGLNQGSIVTLDIIGEESNSIRAKVDRINTQDKDIYVVFQSRDFFPGLYERRNVELMVVRGKYSGLIVPLSSIMKNDDGYAVEVLDADKTIAKKVTIKGHDGTNAVVEKTGSQPELKMYDKVILGKE